MELLPEPLQPIAQVDIVANNAAYWRRNLQVHGKRVYYLCHLADTEKKEEPNLAVIHILWGELYFFKSQDQYQRTVETLSRNQQSVLNAKCYRWGRVDLPPTKAYTPTKHA